MKHRGTFFASGTAGTVYAYVGPVTGRAVCDSLAYDCDAAGTLKFYLARQKTTANAACSASATLVIDTDAAGKVGGAVLTTSDYVLIEDSSGTGWQLRSISAVAAVSSSTVSLTLGATATCAASDGIWIVRAANILSIVTADETQNKLEDLFSSFPGFPVCVALTGSTGSKTVSGTYHEEE